MTIEQFSALVMVIDPNATRYDAIGQHGDSYTVFSDYHTRARYANGVPAGTAVSIQVDYFTRTENDPKATAFFNAFSQNDEITCVYDTDFENDSRYIHHIFDCEVIT